jgi:hypothetical protein
MVALMLRLTSLLQWLLLAVLAWLNAGCARLAIPAEDVPLRAVDGYFPGAAWHTSPPEAQGIDSETLVEIMDAVEANHLPIHSLRVVRYGHLVLDAHFHPFLPGERHDVASVTKSVTTTLVGLALERGALAGLDAPVYPMLSPAPPAVPRARSPCCTFTPPTIATTRTPAASAAMASPSVEPRSISTASKQRSRTGSPATT